MQALSLETQAITPVDPGDRPRQLAPRQVAVLRFRTDKVAKSVQRPPLLDLTDFKRDLSELTDRLGNAQDCL